MVALYGGLIMKPSQIQRTNFGASEKRLCPPSGFVKDGRQIRINDIYKWRF